MWNGDDSIHPERKRDRTMAGGTGMQLDNILIDLHYLYPDYHTLQYESLKRMELKPRVNTCTAKFLYQFPYHLLECARQ